MAPPSPDACGGVRCFASGIPDPANRYIHAPREHCRYRVGTQSSDCSHGSFPCLEDLGMADHATGRKASRFVLADAWFAVGIGSGWPTRIPRTDVWRKP